MAAQVREAVGARWFKPDLPAVRLEGAEPAHRPASLPLSAQPLFARIVLAGVRRAVGPFGMVIRCLPMTDRISASFMIWSLANGEAGVRGDEMSARIRDGARIADASCPSSSQIERKLTFRREPQVARNVLLP
jgi:hypothetical protein